MKSHMNSQAVSTALSSWGLLKRALFLTLGLMFVFVLWRNERFIVDHTHPDWDYYSPVRWWLIPHGLGGLTALVTGPFQFSLRFRQQHLRWHRAMGRCYLGGVAIAVPSSVYLSLTHTTLAFRFLLLTLAGAWLFTTAIAFAAVLNGHVQIHRQWMVRSYAITTTFVTTRVLTAIPSIGGGGEAIYVPAQWSLLVATMVLAELGLTWRALFVNTRQPIRQNRTLGVPWHRTDGLTRAGADAGGCSWQAVATLRGSALFVSWTRNRVGLMLSRMLDPGW
jgi:hypothetical protein